MAAIAFIPTFERKMGWFVFWIEEYHGMKENIIRKFYVEHDRSQNKMELTDSGCSLLFKG